MRVKVKRHSLLFVLAPPLVFSFLDGSLARLCHFLSPSPYVSLGPHESLLRKKYFCAGSFFSFPFFLPVGRLLPMSLPIPNDFTGWFFFKELVCHFRNVFSFLRFLALLLSRGGVNVGACFLFFYFGPPSRWSSFLTIL